MMAPGQEAIARAFNHCWHQSTFPMRAAGQQVMDPVKLPEDDEEFHDAPEVAHAEHLAADGREHAFYHSDDEHVAFHDAAEDACHLEGGGTSARVREEAASDDDKIEVIRSTPVGSQPNGGAASGRSVLTDSDAVADGFLNSPDQRVGAAAAHGSDDGPASDQFRPYADQQPEVGRLEEVDEEAAEALTPEEAQVQHTVADQCYLRSWGAVSILMMTSFMPWIAKGQRIACHQTRCDTARGPPAQLEDQCQKNRSAAVRHVWKLQKP